MHNPEEQRYHYWNTRTLYLIDDVLSGDDEGYACTLFDQFIELNSRDSSKPIYLVIKSNGGSMSTMGAIIDYMQAIKAPVYTQVIGDVASAAAIVATLGEKGHRYISNNARIMIHEPWTCGVGGKLSDVSIEQKELSKFRTLLINLLVEATGQTAKKVQKDIQTDKWMWANEAKAYGLVDNIGIIPDLLTLPIPELFPVKQAVTV